MSQFFASGGQSTGASVSASVLPMNIQDWFLLQLTGVISLLSKHHDLKASILWCSAFLMVQLSHPYMITGKTIALTIWTFVSKVISLFFNMLSKFVIAFHPRSSLLISCLQSPSAVILEGKKIKSVTLPIVFPSICHEVMGLDVMIFIFWMLSFKPGFSLSSFTFINRLFGSSSLSAKRVVSSAYLRLQIFLLAILIPACDHPVWHFSCCTLHISLISRVTYTDLTYTFPNFEPAHWSMSGSSCCLLTYIQVSQETGKMV